MAPAIFESRSAALGALNDGEQIAATILEGGKPAYFLVRTDATDEDVRDRAFEIKHGRPIGPTELTLDAMGKRRRLWK